MRNITIEINGTFHEVETNTILDAMSTNNAFVSTKVDALNNIDVNSSLTDIMNTFFVQAVIFNTVGTVEVSAEDFARIFNSLISVRFFFDVEKIESFRNDSKLVFEEIQRMKISEMGI